jgi:hypothetical protein
MKRQGQRIDHLSRGNPCPRSQILHGSRNHPSLDANRVHSLFYSRGSEREHGRSADTLATWAGTPVEITASPVASPT